MYHHSLFICRSENVLETTLQLKSESEVKLLSRVRTLCDPMDCSLPGSSVHGIFQARVLEWVAISFSRGPSQPKDRTWISCIADRCFTIWSPYIYIHSHIYTHTYVCMYVCINEPLHHTPTTLHQLHFQFVKLNLIFKKETEERKWRNKNFKNLRANTE